MTTLAFVDWRSVQARFCVLMWLIAGLLALVMLAHTGDSAAGVRHALAATARR